MMDPQRVSERVQDWVGEVVVGLGLCPFAAVPFREGKIRYHVCAATDDDALYRAFLSEVQLLLEADPQQLETSLFIVPDALAGFEDYLDMLAELTAALDQAGLDGVLQLASFHPQYRFADTPDDDPANYSNRSPYPLFHLIREEGLAAALESCPDPGLIPLRNQRLLREMGVDAIRRLLNPR